MIAPDNRALHAMICKIISMELFDLGKVGAPQEASKGYIAKF